MENENDFEEIVPEWPEEPEEKPVDPVKKPTPASSKEEADDVDLNPSLWC